MLVTLKAVVAAGACQEAQMSAAANMYRQGQGLAHTLGGAHIMPTFVVSVCGDQSRQPSASHQGKDSFNTHCPRAHRQVEPFPSRGAQRPLSCDSTCTQAVCLCKL